MKFEDYIDKKNDDVMFLTEPVNMTGIIPMKNNADSVYEIELPNRNNKIQKIIPGNEIKLNS